jgi:hypothetical protein
MHTKMRILAWVGLLIFLAGVSCLLLSKTGITNVDIGSKKVVGVLMISGLTIMISSLTMLIRSEAKK